MLTQQTIVQEQEQQKIQQQSGGLSQVEALASLLQQAQQLQQVQNQMNRGPGGGALREEGVGSHVDSQDQPPVFNTVRRD